MRKSCVLDQEEVRWYAGTPCQYCSCGSSPGLISGAVVPVNQHVSKVWRPTSYCLDFDLKITTRDYAQTPSMAHRGFIGGIPLYRTVN